MLEIIETQFAAVANLQKTLLCTVRHAMTALKV